MSNPKEEWKCPAIDNEWQFVCEHALTHFCPFSPIAVAVEAIKNGFPDCEIYDSEYILQMRQLAKKHELIYIK